MTRKNSYEQRYVNYTIWGFYGANNIQKIIISWSKDLASKFIDLKTSIKEREPDEKIKKSYTAKIITFF